MLINVDNFTMEMLITWPKMLITYDGQIGGAYYYYIYIYLLLNSIFFGVTIKRRGGVNTTSKKFFDGAVIMAHRR
jgi:hypothetical protein